MICNIFIYIIQDKDKEQNYALKMRYALHNGIVTQDM